MSDREDPSVSAAYVILTHGNWAQVDRLAAAILRSSPRARVLVAHDARREAFPSVASDARVVIHPHGLRSDWGSWELVEATLTSLARARELFDPPLTVLISGADYPARPLAEWESEALDADSWIGSAQRLEYHPRWGRRRGSGDDRYTRYAFRWYRPPWAARAERAAPWWGRIRHAVALRLEPVFGVRYVTRGRGMHYGFVRLPRPFTARRPCYFGSQMFAVRRPELDLLLDHDLSVGSPLWRLYRRTVIPDESAIVTALARRHPPSGMAPVSHTRWDAAADASRTWTIEHLDEIRSSGSPFCRKTDPVRSAGLLARLDELI